MARGSARLFGIELTQNFDSPYMATSVPEFWRHWHITFSRWILDYIFKPLQMLWRNLGKFGTAFALVIAFLISGLWHGAKAGFIVWGALHGIYLAASVFYAPFRKKWQKKHGIVEGKLTLAWRRFFTFNLICFAWIFFRADNINDAVYIVNHILDIKGSIKVFQSLGFVEYVSKFVLLGNGKFTFLIIFVSIAVYLVVKKKGSSLLSRQPTWLRWCAYYSIVLAILLLTAPTTQFIYFQF
jgi:D-alanyl-lipoteichoic acid acyltransferase DltB (MBOAT superfamily)